ncbi:MAG: OFA family MFS transporter [Candidatus Bathyarchaeia archaeon]
MNQHPNHKRWIVVVGAILIQICLGAVYAFSVLVPPLEGEFHWSRIETSPAFTIALLVFALSMVPAGKLQDKMGPRLVATLGGIFLGLSMILSSFTNSLIWLYISYGLIGGLGIGFAYGAPIATCVKWFPDKRGLITGLAVFGFGAGSIIFAPLWAFLIEATHWRITFSITGILFLLLILPSAQILKNPPQEFGPTNWKPTAKMQSIKDFSPSEMLKSVTFFLIWASYWFGTTAGLMVIGHAKQASMELAGLDGVQASFVVSLLGLFNASGRILWGFLGDRYGREKILTLIFAVCCGALFISSFIYESAVFTLGIILVGLSFGGFLAIYPALTSDYYGIKNLGVNYGIIFTAYGAGGILGPIMAGYFRTYANSYAPSFYIAGALALVGIILTFLTKRFSTQNKTIT